MKITQFCLDRLSDVERLAKTATPGPWYSQPNDLIGGWCVMPTPRPPSARQSPQDPGDIADFTQKPDADYMACWHPGRVLRWCEEQRKIVESYRRLVMTRAHTTTTTGVQVGLSSAVRALAATWSDHPEYPGARSE